MLNKQSAIEMRLVARALELLGIQRQGEFLRRYTTTIGRRIYTPFTVGVADSTYSLGDQLVVCVHEHQHVAQYDRNGLSFQLSYLFNTAARAQWEAEGYRCDLELHFWRYGETPPVRPIAEKLLASRTSRSQRSRSHSRLRRSDAEPLSTTPRPLRCRGSTSTSRSCALEG